MEPIQFPQANKVLAKPPSMTDEECSALPVFNDGTQSISCWQMTWRERIAALVFGKVWLFVVYGSTQPPVLLLAKKTVFLELKEKL